YLRANRVSKPIQKLSSGCVKHSESNRRLLGNVASEILVMVPEWHHGYPQPEKDFGFLHMTYDPTSLCRLGTGAVQMAPFRIKNEPKWGRRGILQLNWIFDEYFVRPEVWHGVFQPLGVRCRPVLLHSTGNEAASIVQLDIDTYIDVGVEGIRFKSCPF